MRSDTEGANALLTSFDRVYVINLPHRTDRRAEAEAQLRRVGLSFQSDRIHLFPAIRPDDAGPFPSVGARGCFLSHLGVLRDAREVGHESIFILEDDADVANALFAAGRAVHERLRKADWDVFYAGYIAFQPVGQESAVATAAPDDRFQLAHSIGFSKDAIEKLVPYLEAILGRPGGDPEGGPMHVDGAYNWFRRENPDMKTMITREQLFLQRASKTDIGEASAIDRLPFASLLRRAKNKLRR